MIPHLTKAHQGALLLGRPGGPRQHRVLADARLFEWPEPTLTPLGVAVRDAIASERDLCPLTRRERLVLIHVWVGWSLPPHPSGALARLSKRGLLESGWLNPSRTLWGWRVTASRGEEVAKKWVAVWWLTNRRQSG